MKRKHKSSIWEKAISLAYAQWLRENPTDKSFEKWWKEICEKWRIEGKGKSFEKWFTERTHPKTSANTMQDALRKVCDVLTSEGFLIDVHGNYIFAKRKHEAGLPFGLFISVQKKETPLVRKYAEVRSTIICPVKKFRQRLSSLMQWWFYRKQKPINQLKTNELDTNVLTSFGWHAYLNKDTRQKCLLFAMYELGETRVANVLLWLKNTWPNNLIMPEEYSFNVTQDYNWVRSNFEENTYYLILKNELLSTLQRECQRLIRERRIKLFEDTKAIKRFFLVTY